MEVFEKLTARERDILGCLAEGLSNRAIAERLMLALTSVKWYNNQIFSKLGAATRAEAVARARELGLLGADEPDLTAAVIEAPPGNLPVELTSLVGREAELADVARLLDQPDTRLLSIIGAGGCGKTRLALRAGAEFALNAGGGVWLVELAPINDPAVIAHALVSALGVILDPGSPPLDGLVRHLKPRETLLILDNCEHLIDAAGHLAASLLRACPRLQILATSREPLGVPGEMIYRLPSLGLPPEDWDGAPPFAASVQLFIERAARVSPGYSIQGEEARVVGRICRRLDGIPLAIELAAARVNLLPAAEIDARLGDSLHLLTGGSRTLLPRQQTLRGSIEWSCRLLSAPEKRLMARLSIFAGGCTLAAAEAVCASPPGARDGLARDEILEQLGALVNKSLVSADVPGGELRQGGTRPSESRYRMLEVVRQCGHESLEQSGEHDSLHTRHYQWCLDFALQVDAGVLGPERRRWSALAETELPNLRLALAFSLSPGRPPEMIHKLVDAMAQFWQLRGYLREGMRWIDAALARADGVAPRVLAATYVQASFLVLHLWDLDRAQHALEQALAIYRPLDDVRSTASALSFLGLVFLLKQDFARARALNHESLELLRGHTPVFAAAVALQHLGDADFLEGDFTRAEQYYTESLSISRQVGNELGSLRRLVRLAQAAAARGDAERARALLFESIQASRGTGDRWIAAMHIVAAASLTFAEGRALQAARFIGTAQVFMETFGTHHLWSVDRRIYDDLLHRLPEQLGADAFAAALDEGRRQGCDPDRAIDFAYNVLVGGPSTR